MTKTSCFAHRENKCGVTYNKTCKGCKFYKTDKQFREGFLKSKRRLEKTGYLAGAKEKYNLLGEMCQKIGG